ncbi:hypothetical protein ScPMuIL_016514 [Solemya velum]
MEKDTFFCPRLLDYILIVGSRHPNHNNNVAQTPELLHRYPLEDHADFPLPPDIIFFCQPEGCISVGPKRMSLRETTSFVFTLTEKDSGKTRYGVCVNFFRAMEKRSFSSDRHRSTGNYNMDNNLTSLSVDSETERPKSPRTSRRAKAASRVRNNTLTSLCIVSHHPFFSTFRECLFILRRLIDACHERSCTKRIGGSKTSSRETVWGILTGQGGDNTQGLVMHDIREIETWMLHLLSAPVPVPGKTRVEVQVLPKDVQLPLLFALPDHTRFSLVDFPLHLPLELLGIETCLKVLTAIILEHKIVMQSRDYNALSMSVMAFVSMLYPLEYMFPVIPLLPTCMTSAEQLLSAPTPYIIGVPASFFLYKKDFLLPDDVCLVDLDSNKIMPARGEEIPPLPEPEGTVLKNHLKQALASMSMTPQPIKNLDVLAQNPEIWKRRESFSSQTGFNPLIYGNDVDSVDVATRVAMVRFFNSPNVLGNFSEHTRTLRLYPRPVVAFQMHSFLKSRPFRTHFTSRLARTQAVEYFGEWSLRPKNVVFLRVQTSVFDPALIGDKPKWYAHQLQPVDFRVYDENSTLGNALSSAVDVLSDDNPTDESGSDSDGAGSTSSSYSSLSDFVTDMVNSEIDGDSPAFVPEHQVLTVDGSKVYSPPSKLHLPETQVTNSDSAFSMPDSDVSSSESSSPTYNQDITAQLTVHKQSKDSIESFHYDSGNVTPTSRSLYSHSDSIGSSGSVSDTPKRPPPLQPLTRSLNSAFEAYEKPLPPASPRDRVSLPSSPREKLQHRFQTPSSPRDKIPGHEKPPVPPSPRERGFIPSSPRDRMSHSQDGTVTPLSGITSGHRQSTSSMSSVSSRGSRPSPVVRSGSSDRDTRSNRSSTPSSIISTISNELTDMANSASSTMSEIFGSSNRSTPGQKQSKPFTHLGNRKALVEKSGLVKHATSRKTKDQKAQSESKGSSNSENQQFLKEVVNGVQDGQGVSWLKLGRVRKLMEDENYRNFVVSRLNKNLDKKLADDCQHIEDVCLTKHMCKGMLTLLKALVHGLEHTYQNHGLGGMASAYMVLEIAHTHFWAKDLGSSNRSDTSFTPEISSPYGSSESLSSKGIDSPQKTDARSLHEEHMVAALGMNVTNKGKKCDIGMTHTAESGKDVMREMVMNKEVMKSTSKRLDNRFNSMDSEMSEASTLVSTSSENVGEDSRRRSRINHHTIRGALSDSEMEMSGMVNYGLKKHRSPSVWNNKSTLSTGFRYHDGKLINTSPLLSPDTARINLFEGILGRDRSRLWDQMQFWEDLYLDAVAQERDIIGMDQGPSEMMERYFSLGEGERKRLEQDEDRLLATMLYNHVAFMVMMNVNKQEIRKKIRRLIGKSHIGLAYSQEINNLLDTLNNLHGNDIDLRPMGSRFMQKQSFTVHWGSDNTGDMLFMEVCDDCIILRSVMGAICDRWWYEKLVNMTYCPKTKVLCLWRKHGDKVQLNQFYTKKCRDLYFCVKEAMEKAAARNNGKVPGTELGGEFPVQDLKSGQGGLLQVCMEGIGLLLANSKLFIELGRIKKCFTQKGGIFILEEFDSKNKQVVQHRFKSSMANSIAVMLHRIFAVQVARQTSPRPSPAQDRAADS